MNFGISTACFYPRQTEQTLTELIQRNVGVCELFINTLSELEPAYINTLSRAAREGGTKIRSLHPFTCAFEPFMLFTDYERRLEDGLEWHRNYFEAMNRLGAEIFVFHGDRMQGKLPDEAYFERFARLRDLGKQFEVVVSQENVERCRSRSIDFLQRMVAYLDGDVALVFDNKQAVRSGVEAEEFISALGDNIVHVHISDNGPVGSCLSISENSQVAIDLLRRLKAVSFDGSVIVELYGEQLENTELAYSSWKNLLNCEKYEACGDDMVK